MAAQILSRLNRTASKGLRRAGNRRLLVAISLVLIGSTVSAEVPGLPEEVTISPLNGGLGVGPAERVFTRSADADGGFATDRILVSPSPDSPAGALSIQSEPVPLGDRLRLRGRFRAGDRDGGVGAGLLGEPSDSWMIAGVLPSAAGWRVALWGSELATAVMAPDTAWTPSPGSWFMLEIEVERTPEGRVLRVQIGRAHV